MRDYVELWKKCSLTTKITVVGGTILIIYNIGYIVGQLIARLTI